MMPSSNVLCARRRCLVMRRCARERSMILVGEPIPSVALVCRHVADGTYEQNKSDTCAAHCILLVDLVTNLKMHDK